MQEVLRGAYWAALLSSLAAFLMALYLTFRYAGRGGPAVLLAWCINLITAVFVSLLVTLSR